MPQIEHRGKTYNVPDDVDITEARIAINKDRDRAAARERWGDPNDPSYVDQIPGQTPDRSKAIPIGDQVPLSDYMGRQEDDSLLDRFGKGAAQISSAFVQSAQGLNQLLSNIPGLESWRPNEQDIEDWRQISKGVPGTINNMAGHAMMLFNPVGRAEKAMTMAAEALPGKVLPATTKAAIPAVTAGAETAILQPTVGDETRAGNALWGASVAGAGGLGLRALGRGATELVKPSGPARRLMDISDGRVQPTVSQGGSGILGETLGFIEEGAASIPGIGLTVRRGQERAGREVMEEVSSRADPYGAAGDTAKRGSYFKNLRKGFDDKYDAELPDTVRVNVPDTWIANTSSKANTTAAHVGDAHTSRLNKDLKTWLADAEKGDLSGREWKNLQSEMRNRIEDWQDNFTRSGNQADKEMAAAYRDVLGEVNSLRNRSMTPDKIATLDALDEQWATANLLRSAAAQKNLGPDRAVTIGNLLDQVETDTPRGLKVEGSGRLQDITEDAAEVFKDEASNAFNRKLGLASSGVALGTGYINPLIPAGLLTSANATSQRHSAKALMGGYDWQKSLAENLRKDVYPYVGTGLTIAGSTGE